jgi:hypothetical protein
VSGTGIWSQTRRSTIRSEWPNGQLCAITGLVAALIVVLAALAIVMRRPGRRTARHLIGHRWAPGNEGSPPVPDLQLTAGRSGTTGGGAR